MADTPNPTAHHEGYEPILQFFQYTHLPAHLQAESEPFCRLAEELVARHRRNPERSVALRKLLEAKDAAVRSALYVQQGLESVREASR